MEAAETSQMGRQHIFVVNGAPDFLDVVRELLQEAHYNVTTTNYIPRTFEQIAALNPALLIMDLAVGITAGWDLLEHLRVRLDDREGGQQDKVGFGGQLVRAVPRLVIR